MKRFRAFVTFIFSAKKSPTNRIWPPPGDWPLRPNHVRYRNVWYLVGKIIHRAIFSQKLRFLPWSSDALLAIKVRAGEKDPPLGFQRSKKPGAHRVKNQDTCILLHLSDSWQAVDMIFVQELIKATCFYHVNNTWAQICVRRYLMNQ